MAMAKRVFLFVLVNILILVTINIVLSVLGIKPYISDRGIDFQSLAAFCLIWGFGGAFISLALSRFMAKMMMGVRVIDPHSQDHELRELVQTIHHLAKSAGLSKMPEVGIYESPEVNAFATGPTKNRALVAVSSGLLRRMNRSQLEGVLGHEIAHITNGDMVTMTLLQGVINAFVMFIARVIAWVVSQNVKEESRHIAHFAIVLVLEIILSILGSMVVAYFSRMREFKADAGGAQLAGRSSMIDALRALQKTTQLIDQEHQAVATFKISGKKGGSSFLALFATHPPLEERIARLEMQG